MRKLSEPITRETTPEPISLWEVLYLPRQEDDWEERTIYVACHGSRLTKREAIQAMGFAGFPQSARWVWGSQFKGTREAEWAAWAKAEAKNAEDYAKAMAGRAQ